MKAEELGSGEVSAVCSISGGVRVVTLLRMELALAELRDLEWRAPAGGMSLAGSPWAKDGPWSLAQAVLGEDVAAGSAEYSETLLTNAAGKELLVRKVDTMRPRSPLSVAEVARLEELRGWLMLLPDALDRRVIWEGAFHLWRAEPFDWPRMARRIDYPRSVARLAGRYREAVAKLCCRVSGVPERHHRALLARESGYFTSAVRQESLGFGAVKW